MMLNMINSALSVGMLDTVSLYIDPTAITTSLVSASGVIIALGASAGVILGKMTTASATLNVFFSKVTRVIVNTFGIVDYAGRDVEPDINLTVSDEENVEIDEKNADCNVENNEI